MGSPLVPLLANVFMFSIDDKLDQDSKLPSYYRRYVDDTFSIMLDKAISRNFLDTLVKTISTHQQILLWR